MEEGYYIQDVRRYIGNSVVWWAVGGSEKGMACLKRKSYLNYILPQYGCSLAT